MVVTIYVDGAGGSSSGYGYFVRETGESEYVDKPGLTNNQAEYSAVLVALERFAGSAGPTTILSDSQVVVRQINHEYARFCCKHGCCPHLQTLHIIPEHDRLRRPHSSPCLTFHRGANARTLRVQTPLNMGVPGRRGRTV